jgi:Polysaccharide pyruvyl transferase
MRLLQALFSRTEPNKERRFRYAALNYYPFRTNNLGDEIQTIAALRFLPRVDAWVQRELLDEFSSEEPHKIILNGWFLHCPEHWPPSPSLRPLIISFHLTRLITAKFNNRLIPPAAAVLHSAAGLNYLKQHEPIGARDLDTLAQLQSVGVRAYFSGCLTLTLERPKSEPKRTGIIAVDVPDEVLEYFSEAYHGPIMRVSHRDSELQGAARFERASELLQLYATAKAVVTCRLHCALPCLAFNTPVLLIENAEDSYRFRGLRDLIQHTTVEDILRNRCKFDLRAPAPNGNEWHALRDDLVRRCCEFIKS